MKLDSAAVLVPFDIILRGEIDISQHIKTVFGCLRSANIQLKKISIVEENVDLIGAELQLLSKTFGLVIVLSSQASQALSKALADITSQNVTKFVDLEPYPAVHGEWPTSVKLLKSRNVCPVIYVQRIFIVTFDSLKEQLDLISHQHLRQYQSDTCFTKVFSVNLNGSKKYLKDIAKNANFKVDFERKSCTDGIEHGALTLKTESFDNIVKGELLLRDALGSDILNSNWIDESGDLIYQSTDSHIKHSIEVIEKCLEDFGVDNVFLSFNGGKDCTVLLHLVLTVIRKKYPRINSDQKLFCLYVKSDNAFKEQDEFIEQCMVFYNLQVMSVTGNIKDALRITINKKPNLKACFMGTRRTDPYCFHLNAFQMTDPDWPQVMRCSPFLDWHYTDIWDYLLYYKVPYCKLYDYGYTSLGNAINTIRNPSLRFYDGDREVYLPAYKMLNEKNERSGRNASKI